MLGISVFAAQTTVLEFDGLARDIIAKPEAPKPQAVLAVLLRVS
jgi:hypothetical protein